MSSDQPASWSELVRTAAPIVGRAAARQGRVDISELISGEHAPLTPRGLLNDGNMCFSSAILQALLYCRPLANLLGTLAAEEDLPYTQALRQFYLQFTGDGTGSFLPTSILSCLKTQSRPSSPFSVSGSQEDAEEFLTFLLSSLHSELLYQPEEDSGASPDGWLEAGPSRRVAQTRTHTEQDSPISELFWGRLKSILDAGGRRSVSITFEPFQCLPLEIDVPEVRDIPSALAYLTRRELLPEQRKYKQVLLEACPPVLILQLKRFDYREGVVQKILKPIAIPAELCSNDRTYSLRSIVYHIGRGAGGGHYTAHCRQFSSGREGEEWIHFDDATVTRHDRLQACGPHETPYLVFYEQTAKDKRKEDKKDRPVPSGSRFANLART